MIRRLLLVVTSLGIALVGAELLLPLVPPHLGTMQRIVHHVDQSGNYYLRPDVEVPFAGMFERISPAVTWQTNHQALRDDAEVGPPSQRFRIASYGDSETFGWSVSLKDTFQRRMQDIDPEVEVINLGIPGYNVENVADRIEATLSTYSPDLVVYLVNKNDVDLPNDISDAVLGSELLLRLRFLYQVVLTKPWRQQRRRSPERLTFLAGQVDRIAAYAASRGVPVLFVFMRDYTWDGAAAQAAPGGFVAAASSGAGGGSFERGLAHAVVVHDLIKPFPRIDDHMSREAHAVLARRLCSEISRNGAAACRPASWTAERRGAPAFESAADSTVAADRHSAADRHAVQFGGR